MPWAKPLLPPCKEEKPNTPFPVCILTGVTNPKLLKELLHTIVAARFEHKTNILVNHLKSGKKLTESYNLLLCAQQDFDDNPKLQSNIIK